MNTNETPAPSSVAVGMLLLSEYVPADQLVERLRAAQLPAALSEAEAGEPVVELQLDDVSVFVTALRQSLPGDDVLNNIHPMLAAESETQRIAEHAAHLVVVATQFGEQSPASRLAVHQAHTTSVRELAQLEQAVGYAIDGTTMGIVSVRELAEDPSDVPVQLWAPIWVWSGDSGITAYTYGLAAFGHPELQIVDADVEAAEAFVLLEGLGKAVMGGGQVGAGDAVERPSGGEASVSETHWVVEPDAPARQVDF